MMINYICGEVDTFRITYKETVTVTLILVQTVPWDHYPESACDMYYTVVRIITGSPCQALARPYVIPFYITLHINMTCIYLWYLKVHFM